MMNAFFCIEISWSVMYSSGGKLSLVQYGAGLLIAPPSSRHYRPTNEMKYFTSKPIEMAERNRGKNGDAMKNIELPMTLGVDITTYSLLEKFYNDSITLCLPPSLSALRPQPSLG